MECPKCKSNIDESTKFCPYCGTAVSNGKGLISDDDCPARDHKDAVILKPKDFKESKGITDDGGMTFAERELLSERNNSEYKEYEQRDDRFDYFANDSRYNDFSRFNIDQSVYAPTERASVYDEQEKLEQEELDDINKSRAQKSAETLREYLQSNQKAKEAKPKEKKPKIKRTDTTISWDKDGRTKKRPSKLVKIIIVFVVAYVLVGVVPLIYDVVETGFSSSEKGELGMACDDLAYALYNYDYSDLLSQNYDCADDDESSIDAKANALIKASGSKENACIKAFKEIQKNSGTDYDFMWDYLSLNFEEIYDRGSIDGNDAVTVRCELYITARDITSENDDTNDNFYINFVNYNGSWYYTTKAIDGE